MNIYALSESIQELQDMLEEEENQEVISEVLKSYEMQFEEKAEAYARVDKNLAAQEEALKAESERLEKRAKVIKNNRESLRKNLENAMILTDKRKFKTNLFNFNIQKNPPSCEIVGEVPDEFLIPQEPKVDKKAISARLKAGETFEFAVLKQTESLRIR